MAKVRCNAAVRELSGAIGNMVFRQMPDGSTYVSSKQDFSRRKFSQKQKDHQERLRWAAAYAREAAKSKPIYAQLAAGTGLSPYNFALADWFHAPVIHEIEQVEGRIRILATDNVRVAGVQVLIVNEQIGMSEKGEAVREEGIGEGDWWEYTPVLTGKIVVEARDLAGNAVRAEMSE